MMLLIFLIFGFFEVDVKNKCLWIFVKGGCCYYEIIMYCVDYDVLVVVVCYSEEVMNFGDKMKIIEEMFVNGKWCSKVYYELILK